MQQIPPSFPNINQMTLSQQNIQENDKTSYRRANSHSFEKIVIDLEQPTLPQQNTNIATLQICGPARSRTEHLNQPSLPVFSDSTQSYLPSQNVKDHQAVDVPYLPDQKFCQSQLEYLHLSPQIIQNNQNLQKIIIETIATSNSQKPTTNSAISQNSEQLILKHQLQIVDYSAVRDTQNKETAISSESAIVNNIAKIRQYGQDLPNSPEVSVQTDLFSSSVTSHLTEVSELVKDFKQSPEEKQFQENYTNLLELEAALGLPQDQYDFKRKQLNKNLKLQTEIIETYQRQAKQQLINGNEVMARRFLLLKKQAETMIKGIEVEIKKNDKAEELFLKQELGI